MEADNYNNDLTFDEKVMMGIVGAAENFKRTQATIFKKFGLSFPQYNILRVLDASKGGKNKISAVGKIMLTPGANMTGLAKRLEQQGCILRKSDPNDERVTQLVITQKGKDLLKQIENKKDVVIDQVLEGLSKKTKKEYLEITRHIIKTTTRLQKNAAHSK